MSDFHPRKARELARQLPAGEPPAFVPDGRPQPLPSKRRVAQVFTTWEAMPIAARIFAEQLNVAAVPTEGAMIWRFSLGCPNGYVMIVREHQTFAPETSSGSVPVLFRATVGKNGASDPFIDQLRVEAGDVIPVYQVIGQGESADLVLVGTGVEETSLRLQIRGELIRQRGFVPELEVGHDAPIVKPVPIDPGDL